MGCCCCCCREEDVILTISKKTKEILGNSKIDDAKYISILCGTVVMTKRQTDDCSIAERIDRIKRIIQKTCHESKSDILLFTDPVENYIVSAYNAAGMVVDGGALPAKSRIEIADKLKIVLAGGSITKTTLIDLITYIVYEYVSNRRGSAEEFSILAAAQIAAITSGKETTRELLTFISVDNIKRILEDIFNVCC